MFKNNETYQSAKVENGLNYSNIEIKDLVNKDTDADGIPDWEEGLYGLDPIKKETTPGTPDNLAIEKMKAAQANTLEKSKETTESAENLTQTEKFSRELFATIAAASQGGTIDQTTIDELGAALAEKIRNPAARKVFLISELQTTKDNFQAFMDYNDDLKNIIEKNSLDYTVPDVLQKFLIDEDNVDMTALAKLDPIIAQTNKIITEMAKMNVPQSLSTPHLNVVNSLEELVENLNDIKLFESDVIVALGGISQFETNAAALESNLKNLADAINQKLNN